MKKPIVIFTMLGLSALGIVFFYNLSFVPRETASEVGFANSAGGSQHLATAQTLNSDVEQLQLNYLQLQQQQMQFQTQLNDIQNSILQTTNLLDKLLATQSSSQTDVKKEATLTSSDEISAVDPYAADLAAKQQIENRMIKLENAMLTQDRDPNWSDSANSELTDTVSRETFPDSTLLSSDCRTSLCTIEVSHVDMTAKDKFLNEFPGLLGWKNSRGEFETIEESGAVITKLYITRSNYDSPAD